MGRKGVEIFGDDSQEKLTVKEVEEWVASLTEDEKTKFLCDLLLEKDLPQTIQRKLLNRFYKERTKSYPKSPGGEKKKPKSRKKP